LLSALFSGVLLGVAASVVLGEAAESRFLSGLFAPPFAEGLVLFLFITKMLNEDYCCCGGFCMAAAATKQPLIGPS
jgi:hypothetical protein